MNSKLKYKYSDYSIALTAFIAVLSSYFLVWKNHGQVNTSFIDGDTEYYYYYLQSTFIDSSLINYDWLKPDFQGALSHHPVGMSLVLLPFFLLSYLAAYLFHFPLDGLSLPFQIGIASAAIFYTMLGLIYLKKLFFLNQLSDRVTATTILLLFTGTTLFHYAIVESAMSHVFSFCFINIFLFHSNKLVLERKNHNLIYASLAYGMILMLRPNNALIALSVFLWFRSLAEANSFIKAIFRNRYFYYAILIVLAFVSIQILTWAIKEKVLFSNRYAPYGFYWFHPAFFKMLFGFDSGFFIYTPLCFLFLWGLIFVYQENRFAFAAFCLFLSFLFYFFSAYSAYTYFDGLGIRVLIDYYALFALLGAKLLNFAFDAHWPISMAIIFSAAFFVLLNLVYTYQSSRGILLRAGMTFEQWKFVFLRTGFNYRNCLGGANELRPYAKNEPGAILNGEAQLDQAFDYRNKDYGVVIHFDSIGFTSNRIHLEIQCERREMEPNSSSEALVCIALEDKYKGITKTYAQFRMNEIPSTACCEIKHYNYATNVYGDFQNNNRLTVFIWNIKKQAFEVSKLLVKVFNYNYEIK